MTLNRHAASALLARHESLLRGRVLELGVGEYPYASTATTVSIDIDADYDPQVQGDAHHLPFCDGGFDTVVASQVFEHLRAPSEALGEIGRVLRPGGHLILAMPFLFMLHQTPHDYQRLTRFGLEQLFADLPFAVEIDAFGGRIPAVIDLLVTSTPSSSVPRRAVRKARRSCSHPSLSGSPG